ncbi:MAG TPA: Ig-like domain-containing protein [Clostridia bacterium]|nr:Ig-like domain-containing protein [Clostridia bacterium]
MFKKSGRKLLSVLVTLAIVISLMFALTLTANAAAVDLSLFPQANDYGATFVTSDNSDMKLTVHIRDGGNSPYADYSTGRKDIFVGDYEDDFGVAYATFEKSNSLLFAANSITIKPDKSDAIITIYGVDASDNKIGDGITTSMITAGHAEEIDLAADGDFTLIKKLKIEVPGTGYYISALDVTAATSYNAPALTATGGNQTFVENGSPVDLFSSVTAATNDSGQTFSGMTLTVSNVTDTKEYLSIGGTDVELVNGKSGTISGIGNYSVAVSSNTATVTVSGMTLSDAQMGTLIDGITYRNSSDNPTTANNRAIKINSITDSGSSSNSASPNITSTVSLTAVNDAPTFKTNTGITVNEGSTDNAIAKGNLEITDVDTAASSITYTLTVMPTNGTLKKSGTTLNTTTNRTFTQDDINNNRLTYTHDGSETTSDSFKFTVSDGAGGSIVETTFAIMVSPVNDLPTITNSTKNGTEDTTLTFAATDFTGHYNDAESAALSEIEIVTLPSALHGILKLDGSNITVGQKIAAANLTKITFEPVANFTGNANFTWKASDGTGYSSAAATMTLAMAGVNDAPNITSGATANFAENGTGTVYTATGTDPDTGDALTWSISGADAGLFNINSSTGVLTFKTAPNFESPADSGTNNVYDLTITATDNGTGTLTATKTIAITVTNINEAPTITSGATASFEENGTGTVYTAAGSDQDGDSITWSISGIDSSLFNIDSGSGVLTFKTAPHYNSPTDNGGNNIYDVTITATDGTLTTTKALAVTVTNINDAPSITSGDAANFAENGTGTVYTATRTDPDASDTVTWSLGGADKDIFNIDSDGKVTFKTEPNYEDKKDAGADNVYNITVTATDGGGLTASKGVAITVTNVNEAPTITSGTTASVAENQTSTGYTAEGSDEDGGSITWSITGGADYAKFAISAGGVLTFNSAPDYDIPTDVGANNTYEVIIQASDGSIATTKTVTVTVTNVNEAPTVTSGETANFAENGTGTVYTATQTDPDASDTVTWSLGGADKDIFSIAVDGKVTFKTAPNYEDKKDAGADNVYNITVTATDGGGLTASKDVAITVTNVNEAPTITSGTTVSTAENQTSTGYTAEGTDEDGGSITWSITGGADSAKFAISAGGVLTFNSAPDYDIPTDVGANNTYEVIIQASDGSIAATKTVTVTVTNVNEAPTVTSGATANFAENGTGTVYTATRTDPDASDTVTWSLGGADKDIFSIAADGKVTFKTVPNYEDKKDVGTDNVYNITVTATDGGGLTASKDVAITVTNVDETPTITTTASVSVTEGSTTAFTAAATDPEGSSITWSITGGADAGKFSIVPSTGVVTFTATPSYSAPTDADTHNDYILEITASDGTLFSAKTVTVTVTQKVTGGGGSTTPAQPSGTGVEILVNGKTETAATATTTQEGNQTVTTVTVDDKKVEEKLQAEGNNATVTIPVKNDADVVVGQLNGQTVKNMETKEAVLEIKTENVTYTLPASQINIDNVSDQIGQQVELKDIKVNVTISAPPADTVKVVEDTANKNNYQVVVKPVEFNITCSSGNKTVEVSKFNGYVDRMVAIPDGIDPSKITTGIVLNSDGTFSHVPTVITKINGKYYAKINSLTNSTYSVIWSPKTFKDVENHWAKDAVNDMGSRLVISGVGNDNFAPDRDITRAEFAAIVVRGLGLMHPGTGKASFSDVSKNDWYYDAVSIAYEYGIISGYGKGKFGPNDKITHEQAMSMIARAMKITKLKADFKNGEAEQLIASYGDFKKASSWAKNSIALCVKTGVVPDGSGKLAAPKDNITRAEVAVIVQRLLQKSNLI